MHCVPLITIDKSEDELRAVIRKIKHDHSCKRCEIHMLLSVQWSLHGMKKALVEKKTVFKKKEEVFKFTSLHLNIWNISVTIRSSWCNNHTHLVLSRKFKKIICNYYLIRVSYAHLDVISWNIFSLWSDLFFRQTQKKHLRLFQILH